MSRTVYLDHAANTPLDAGVREAMLEWMQGPRGNPSSRHPLGVSGAEAIDRARQQVARALRVAPDGVTFTSGGTESNSMAVLGIARAARRLGKHVLIGPTEHACVRASAMSLLKEGFEVEEARLDETGALDLADLEHRLRPDTVLVAQMLASNEFGTVYPLRQVARLVRARSPAARLHVDCVQAFGKLDCSPIELGCDSVAISAHKVHGPLGAGALARAQPFEMLPALFGGGQERGLRSGTQNLPAIVGWGLAAELAESRRATTGELCARLRARMMAAIRDLPGVRVLEPGAGVEAPLPSILSLLWPGVPAGVRLGHLELRGVYASAGSACQSKQGELSPALRALGLDLDGARSLMRFSFAHTTTDEEVDLASRALTEVSAELDHVRG
jgi:cysteine desulfurase